MSYGAGAVAGAGLARPLAEMLSGSSPVLSAWSGLPDPLTIEAVSAAPFDAVTLDGQHGGHTEDVILRAVAGIRAAGKSAIARIPVGRFDMASRLVDFGIEAIIAPMINNAADARAFADSVKYPPVGLRSWGAPRAQAFAGIRAAQDWFEQANAMTLAIAMIETRGALDQLDAILAEPGIDGVFVGPNDLSIALTGGTRVDPDLPEMQAALAEIAAKARATGRFAGIYVGSPDRVGQLHSLGFRLFALTSDSSYILQGASAQIAQARASVR